MVNIGAVWGLIIAMFVSFVVYRAYGNRSEREVEKINVIRPEEEIRTAESGSDGTESDIDEGSGGEQSEGQSKRGWRIPFVSSKTDDGNQSASVSDSEGDQSDWTAVPPFEPFKD